MAKTAHTKTAPIGVDKQITKCQNQLAHATKGLSWDNVDIYGRMYFLTDQKNKVTAEAHIKGNEYKPVFIDDKLDAVIGFFVHESDREHSPSQNTLVTLACSVMLNRIYADTAAYAAGERMDEEALQEVVGILQGVGGWKIESINPGNIKEVFGSYMDISKLKFRDMQPYANFSITSRVNYRNNICKIL